MPFDIDYSTWRFWFDVVQTGGTIAIGVYVWLVNRKKAVEKRFSGIDRRMVTIETNNAGILPELEKHMATLMESYRQRIDERCRSRERRIDEVEKDNRIIRTKLDHMPNHQDIKELSTRIDQLHGSLSEFNGRLKGINRAVDLMNEFLINQGKG